MGSRRKSEELETSENESRTTQKLWDAATSSPKREIHDITSLPQETRKISNKQSNFILKGARKRTTNKVQSSRRKETSS